MKGGYSHIMIEEEGEDVKKKIQKSESGNYTWN
jgi:hypothetical protein